ncbi:MFS transporter [Phytohabitans rumicis]|uniref:MFS transporter n=1 Tax=Phytohabitans rumicis TaxID=1076125 RepID=UPI0031E597B4
MFSTPGYRELLAACCLWHGGRWGGFFIANYMLLQATGSPLVNQAAGAVFFAPMLLGGLRAGALSGRFDRRNLVRGGQAAVIPVSLLVAGAVWTGVAPVAAAFAFMLTLGICALLEAVALRPLVYETVGGGRLATRAFMVDTVVQASAAITGIMLGGVVVDALGIGVAFAIIGAFFAGSVLLLGGVPSPQAVPTANPVAERSPVRSALRLLRRNELLGFIVAVTLVMNLFYYTFLPLIPALAAEFGSGASLAGLLGACAPAGQALAGLFVGTSAMRRTRLVFTVGAALGLLGLVLTGATAWLPLVFLGLLTAGAGQAGFVTMQSLLSIESTDERSRGIALGSVSVAVGCMPFGLLIVGVAAEILDLRRAVLGAGAVGFTALTAFAVRHRSLLRGHSPQADLI